MPVLGYMYWGGGGSDNEALDFSKSDLMILIKFCSLVAPKDSNKMLCKSLQKYQFVGYRLKKKKKKASEDINKTFVGYRWKTKISDNGVML